MYLRHLVVPCVLTLLAGCEAARTGTFGGGPSGPYDGAGKPTHETSSNHALGGDGDQGDPSDPGADVDAGTHDPATDPGGSVSGTSDGGTHTALTGLPCEVSDLLGKYCLTCHGATPVGGATASLTSLANLTAKSPTPGSGSVAQDALTRMQTSGLDHMPQGGTDPSASELAAFKAWVDAGTPAGECGAVGDGGAPAPAPDPTFTGDTVCTSNQHWTLGNEGSSQMHPGVACINCHSQGEGPSFSLAGTLFPTGHEPDDCLGVDGQQQDVQVIVTDANGQEVSLTVNTSGNFYSSKNLKFPITAKVVSGGQERVMATPVNSGDCNGCHTTDGSQGAPGRIALP